MKENLFLKLQWKEFSSHSILFIGSHHTSILGCLSNRWCLHMGSKRNQAHLGSLVPSTWKGSLQFVLRYHCGSVNECKLTISHQVWCLVVKEKSNQSHYLVLDRSQHYEDNIFPKVLDLSLGQIQSKSDARHIFHYTCRMYKIGHQEFELDPSLSIHNYF